MDTDMGTLLAYLQANPLVAAAVGLLLLWLLLKQTKLLLYLLLLAGVVGASSYLILELSGSGSDSKIRLIRQTDTQDVK